VQTIAKDITEQKKAGEKLKNNEQLFRQLFENSPLGIAMLDVNYKVVRVNQSFTNIFEYEKEEVINQSLTNLVVPEELSEEASNINLQSSNGEICKIETVRKTKSGKLLNVYIYALPVFNEGKIIGIYVDITARITAESELQTRNMELDNFVYKVSHDLRAPLASVLGLINLTRLEGAEADISKYIDLMESRVKKLDRFISDILSHSKNLNMDVHNALIDFNEIIENGFKELDYLKVQKNIRKEINVTGGTFISDNWRIGEIFRNLISNAIKYSDLDKPENRIKIDINISTTEAKICFEDQGIGIPEYSLSAIFDMFYRATEVADGSGIGLYIVKNAITKLGGSIKIHSKEKKGTRFDIVIPAAN
jgi:PAS domain S-box-containing protein